MFENDKGKGILCAKEMHNTFLHNSFYLSAWNVQNSQMYNSIEAYFSKHVHFRLVGYGINLVCYFI